MSLRRFQRQYEQLLLVEREKIIGMMEAGWSARRAAHQLGRSDCVAPGGRTFGIAASLRVLPSTPTHRRFRLMWCREKGNWNASEWNQVVFSDASRFNLNSDDNHVRVWRPHGEHLNPTFA
ncbi:transposable element Tcb1 transposase [Trichonephila clavipes]|nr:transposable element Tcb1 transposase [Trichonephila clavipes]